MKPIRLKSKPQKFKNQSPVAIAKARIADAFLILTGLNGIYIDAPWNTLQEARAGFLDFMNSPERTREIEKCKNCKEINSNPECQPKCDGSPKGIQIIKLLKEYHTPDMSIDRRRAAISLITAALFWIVTDQEMTLEMQMKDQCYTPQAAQDAIYILCLYHLYGSLRNIGNSINILILDTIFALGKFHSDIQTGAYKEQEKNQLHLISEEMETIMSTAKPKGGLA
jgi:hypothetical protein